MITSFIALVGGAVLGALWARKETRVQCGAHDKWTMVHNKGTKDQYEGEEFMKRCEEFVDPRCLGGHCTRHCRSKERCQGKCLAD